MALAIDSQMPSNAGLSQASNTSPWTWSFTNTAGNVIYVLYQINSNSATVSATYGGDSMTQIGSISDNGGGTGTLYLFRKASPKTGANNVAITSSVTAVQATSGAISFSGAKTSPDSGSATSNAWGGSTASAWSVTVTGTTSGNFVLQGAAYGDQQSGGDSYSGSKAFLIELDGSSTEDNLAAQTVAAPGGNVTATITGNTVATSFVTLGIEVLAAPASGGDPVITMFDLTPGSCVVWSDR